MSKIKVSERYPCPGPRFKKLGPNSGEEFRAWIITELKRDNNLEIDLDGTEGYGSSFLEESFGGLIRVGIQPELVKNIKIISTEQPDLLLEIDDYINDAINELED